MAKNTTNSGAPRSRTDDGPRHLYRLLRGDADWRAAVAGDDHWFRDEGCTDPATSEELERADDDIHTCFGMNATPRRYPALAWKEVLR